MIGWAGASGHVELGAWLLFAIVFVWQLPHFFAIAWMYREDYARGGYRMLPSADADGRRTARWVVGYSVVLLAVTLLPGLVESAGAGYMAGAVALGLALLAVGIHVAVHRTTASARAMLLASVLYLPAVMVLLLIDRVIR
jgi:protoheme IX farnesyltransferase